MEETIYRKYRPKNFSEIIGQFHIVKTLSNSIMHNRIGHAYLFTGPRGTGKTSIARIFAKTINCEKLSGAISCEKCQSCKLISEKRSLDIIEIDAASNTGVDNIRELRETVALPPTALKYKIYIIDEVHMLSTGAFNALLKTLEEPPAHVIFILATTEIHKVPETIISRCQRFDFTRLPIPNIIEKLSLITKKEKIEIDRESLEMIAIAAEGGMRDAESLLAQIISLEDKKITKKEVEEILGTTDRETAREVAIKIVANDAEGAISVVNKLVKDGYDISVFNKTLINYLRQMMLLAISPELDRYFTYEMTKEQLQTMQNDCKPADLPKIILSINLFLEAQNKIASSFIPQLPLEIAIVKATVSKEDNKGNKTMPQKNITEKKTENTDIKKTDLPEKKELLVKPDEKEQRPRIQNIDISLVKGKWAELLNEIRPYNHSLNALLSNCQVTNVEGNMITIATPYDFYKERLSEQENKLTVEKIFSSILGAQVLISTILDKKIVIKKEEIPEKNQDSLLNSAMEIMGGKIVEE